ncbi:MAG: choline kinase [Gammaproteobacteria bacterium]|jgi:choline kinase
MRAVILAAGLGWRLGGGEDQLPKCLLEFDGRSLLHRHLDALHAVGITQVTIGVGYRADAIEKELSKVVAGMTVDVVFNADFHEGNVVTLYTLRAAMTAGDDVMLMDADVLYHVDLLSRLAGSEHRNCFLMDRNFEAGDEPVKLCVSSNRLVEFGKQIAADVAYDTVGESVGFFKLSSKMASRLVWRAEEYVLQGRRDAFYEDALRDLLLACSAEFGCEDITGIPWIEIDFQQDIRRAETEVLAHIRARVAA